MRALADLLFLASFFVPPLVLFSGVAILLLPRHDPAAQRAPQQAIHA